MSAGELDAIAALSSSFNWTLSRENVWAASPYHVEDLHPRAAEMIRRGIDGAGRSEGPNPLGVVLVGQPGAGKTHLLGWAREQVQQAGTSSSSATCQAGRSGRRPAHQSSSSCFATTAPGVSSSGCWAIWHAERTCRKRTLAQLPDACHRPRTISTSSRRHCTIWMGQSSSLART